MADEELNTGEAGDDKGTESGGEESGGTEKGVSDFSKGVLSVKTEEAKEKEGESDDSAKAEGDSGEEGVKSEDLSFNIDPELLNDKTISQYVKDGILDVNKMAKSLVEKEKMLRNAVPESYEVEDAFAEHNLSWDSDEQRDEVIAGAKEHKVSQEAMNWMLGIYGERVTAIKQAIGPILEVSLEDEFKAVQQEWGSETKQRVNALTDFVDTNPEVAKMFNLRHREGTLAAYDYYQRQKGPNLIDAAAGGGVEDYQAEIDAIMSDPKLDYFNDPATQKKVTELHKKMAAARNRSAR